jgi:hypothetical protein
MQLNYYNARTLRNIEAPKQILESNTEVYLEYDKESAELQIISEI